MADMPTALFLTANSPAEQSFSNALEGDQPVKLLNREHPEYAARKEAWVDLSLLVEGGAAIKKQASRFLQQRPREDQEVYNARLDRFTYQNIIGTAVGWYVASLFEVPPEIFFRNKKGDKIEDKFYQQFLKDCDRNGTDYENFFRRVFSDMLTYGMSWVLTDLPEANPNDIPPTRQHQLESGLLDAFIVSHSPLQVINWETEANGSLVWVTTKSTRLVQDFLKPQKIVETWHHYTKEEFFVYEAESQVGVQMTVMDEGHKAKFIRSGRHALANVKRVPLRCYHLSENLWLANRVYLQLRDHLNQDNTLAWSLFMSNLAIPVIIGDVDTGNMTASESSHLQFPAGTTYQWSEPEGKSFEHSARRLEALREEIFRSMHLVSQGRSTRATPAMQSGRSKQLEMAPAEDVKAGMGADVRRSMGDLLTDIVSARGDDEHIISDVRGFIFEENMTTEEVFAVASTLNLQIPSKRFEKYVYKKVARAWMPDAPAEEMKKVYDEIDAGPTMEDRQQEALEQQIELARAGMSAAVKKVPGGPAQPPGRGGDGPSPRAK